MGHELRQADGLQQPQAVKVRAGVRPDTRGEDRCQLRTPARPEPALRKPNVRAVDFVAGGWTLQYIGNYSSGMPFGFGATGTPNSNFATNRSFLSNPDGGSLVNPSFNTGSFDMSDISTSRADKNYIVTSARDVRSLCAGERASAGIPTAQLRGLLGRRIAAEVLRAPRGHPRTVPRGV